MINDIKARIPSKKKVEESELDETENSPMDAGDRTEPSLNISSLTGVSEVREADGGDDETEGKTSSLIDKLKAKLSPPKAKAKSKKDDDTNVTDVKAPKKKINPVVLVAVLGGLGALFYFDDAEEPAPVVAQPASKRNKKKVQAPKTETAAATEAAPAAATETTAETPPESTAESTPETSTEAPVLAPETPAEAAPETPSTAEAVPGASPETPVEDPTVTTTSPEETPSETAPPSMDTAPSESADTIDGQVSTDDSNTTDKILSDLEKQVNKEQPKEVKKEYVAPPDYEYKGRGLVYNCAGKHWACVDAPSFKNCEDNFSSVTYKKKTIECYPFNVYQSTKGCEAMQNRVVSSNAKTNFCKGN